MKEVDDLKAKIADLIAEREIEARKERLKKRSRELDILDNEAWIARHDHEVYFPKKRERRVI
jgi:hypothetical protein